MVGRITNAADDDARCDVCGEPNRTGTSVVYVSESWCQQHRLTYSEDLKMCIWCRHGVVKRRHRGFTLATYEEIKARTEKIKEIKDAGGRSSYYWSKLKSALSFG